MMYVDHSNTVGAALSFKLFVPSFFYHSYNYSKVTGANDYV